MRFKREEYNGIKNMLIIFFILFAYLLGSLSTAIIASKIVRLPDPRTQGSGNPGATNILRVAGKKLAIIVLLGDALKGLIPVLLAKVFGISGAALAWIGFAAFIGHLYPIFFQFRGGKGVATFFGVVLALSWLLGVVALLTWIIITFVSRYSSLAAVLTSILLPIYAYWLVPHSYMPAIILMSILLIWRHQSNIKNLLAGKEGKIGEK